MGPAPRGRVAAQAAARCPTRPRASVRVAAAVLLEDVRGQRLLIGEPAPRGRVAAQAAARRGLPPICRDLESEVVAAVLAPLDGDLVAVELPEMVAGVGGRVEVAVGMELDTERDAVLVMEQPRGAGEELLGRREGAQEGRLAPVVRVHDGRARGVLGQHAPGVRAIGLRRQLVVAVFAPIDAHHAGLNLCPARLVRKALAPEDVLLAELHLKLTARPLKVVDADLHHSASTPAR
eukprot:CAMPEP_0185465168 /NCGR_PEP_ID=MMETSP1365-20130426/96094_1 /TAXON_ID=38817 /ORGANISM="Gephyrocapsa oceanica, Strain RCC1303" /LENGTH=234 /DNA_ID=CAMNT_0028071903 /DNA_START=397 /DNA_END=1101 /DNA_ORIENTATION=-